MYRLAFRLLAFAALSVGFLAAIPVANADVVSLNWQFNDSLSDASGNGNTGASFTYAGGWSEGTPSYRTGVFGNAVDLAAAQYIKKIDPTGLPTAGTDAWTVNVWTQMDSTTYKNNTVAGGFGSDPHGSSYVGTKRFLRIRSDTQTPKNAMSFWGNSSGFDYDSPTSFPQDTGAWHMFTATFSGGAGGTLALYLDGTYVNSVIRTFNDAPGAGTLVARVGGDSSTTANLSTSVDGAIDDFSIWNLSLTGGELKAMASTPWCGISALTSYDAQAMQSLVNVYNDPTGATSKMVDSLTWNYAGVLTGHNAGDIWQDGGNYYMQFGSDGTGVTTAAVPEPGTMVLLIVSAVALLATRRKTR
jgi:hypothetical protein